MSVPARGFPDAEFEARTKRAQTLMAQHGLSALLLTTEPEVRYYTGFLTRFWESPTRPWFVVLPIDRAPFAVIPSIGEHLMAQTWVNDIRTWVSPDNDLDGLSLLAEAIAEVVGPNSRLGMAEGPESFARMPRSSLQRLRELLGNREIESDAGITASLRLIKSADEIAKISQAAMIANRAFERVPSIAKVGTSLSSVFRRFQMLCLEEGADWVPYLAGAAALEGYADVISPADDRPLKKGDVLMLDNGLVCDGYFCDFDRNYSIGPPSQNVKDAHCTLIEAIQTAFHTARVGSTFSDLHKAMDGVLNIGPNSGRLGHGLGMQLTEGPSIIPGDDTVLQSGMVLTLEPYVMISDGKMMVHEENIVIEEGGPRFLSRPTGSDIQVI